MPSVAAENACSHRRSRGQPARIVMASLLLPNARPTNVPVVTATPRSSAAALDGGHPSKPPSGNLDSGDNGEALFAEVVYGKRPR